MKKALLIFLLASSLAAQVQIGKNVQIGAGSTSTFITSLTTTGTSGPASVTGGVLNIPQYTFSFTLGSTPITNGSTVTAVTGLSVNGVTLNAAGSSSLFLNQAGGYTAPGGGGAVSSVANSDGTLTVSPTTGSVVASLNLAHANTWTAPISVAVAGGGGGKFDATEGTAATAAAGHDVLYADSTAHCLEYSANGGSFGCIGSGGTVNPVAGASAEYPMLDGSGTTVTDVSGSGNNATFGSTAPNWLSYGLGFNDTGFDKSIHPSLNTPLTTFGAFIVAHCTANMGMNSGTVANLSPVTAGQPFTSTTSSTTGVMIYTSGNSYSGQVSVVPTIVTQPGFATRTDLPWSYGGCHVYGFTLTSPSDGLDHETVDGVEPPNYQDHGSSASFAPISGGGTYQIGVDPFSNALRGVLSYAIYYPTSLTVAQLQSVTSYVQAKLSQRPTFPKYPVLNNSLTQQLIFNGDSLTATLGGAHQWTADVTTNNTYQITNYGIAGLSALDTCHLFAQRWAQQGTPSQSVAVFWAGTNDFLSNGTSASKTWKALSECATTAKQFGIRPVVATMISGSGRDTNKNNLNALIRSQYRQAGFAYLVDLAAAPGLGADGASSNTACYQGDATHLTGPGVGTCETVTTTALSGYGVVAALMSNGVNAADGSTSANPTITASNAFVSTSANRFTIQTPTATATNSLPDCQGLSEAYTVVNGSASFVITVSAINGQTINGTGTVPISSTASFAPVLISPSTAGCFWEKLTSGSSSSTTTIASGTSALGTSAIASAACATVVTTTATGVASTDAIIWNPNGSIKAVTGYVPATTGGLTIAAYPTTNAVNLDVCNWSASSITPGAVTINWRVVR